VTRTDLKHLLLEQERRIQPMRVGPGRTAYLMAKRTMDIVISLVALIFLSPVLAIVALLIKLDSPGPTLFKQIRIGKDGVPFTFYKFRGMFVDARERFPELYDHTYTPKELETLVFHQPNDPRVTRIGRIIRKTAIDELPNFINVLKGDMSLVGPRPEIPELVAYYGPVERKVLSIKPGITALSKVHGRDSLNFRETLDLDLYYMENQSLLLDLEILLKTVKVVFNMEGTAENG
jgi:lipopolysaccharide/colanic/teichoic acid biosynthesis glycosyltransferase